MIIGAQKADTTALYAYLNQHPQNVKEMKEIHFYAVNYDKGME
jgi:hypothetical protein